jgi:hypothetical protein
MPRNARQRPPLRTSTANLEGHVTWSMGRFMVGSDPSSLSRQAATFQAAVFSLLRLCPTYAPYACGCPRMKVDTCGHIFFPHQWIKAILREKQNAVSRTIAAPQ